MKFKEAWYLEKTINRFKKLFFSNIQKDVIDKIHDVSLNRKDYIKHLSNFEKQILKDVVSKINFRKSLPSKQTVASITKHSAAWLLVALALTWCWGWWSWWWSFQTEQSNEAPNTWDTNSNPSDIVPVSVWWWGSSWWSWVVTEYSVNTNMAFISSVVEWGKIECFADKDNDETTWERGYEYKIYSSITWKDGYAAWKLTLPVSQVWKNFMCVWSWGTIKETWFTNTKKFYRYTKISDPSQTVWTVISSVTNLAAKYCDAVWNIEGCDTKFFSNPYENYNLWEGSESSNLLAKNSELTTYLFVLLEKLWKVSDYDELTTLLAKKAAQKNESYFSATVFDAVMDDLSVVDWVTNIRTNINNLLSNLRNIPFSDYSTAKQDGVMLQTKIVIEFLGKIIEKNEQLD